MNIQKIISLVMLFLFLGCSTVEKKQEKKEPPPSPPSFLFPYDMSQWSCSKYIGYMKQNHLYKKLDLVLKKRPHRFHGETNLKNLKPLGIQYVPDKKRFQPNHFVMVHKSVVKSLTRLVDAAQKAGHDLRVQSAFRSVSIQNYLWQSSVRTSEFDHSLGAFKTAPPCFSEHATGKSVDFSLASTEEKIAESDVYPWLMENAQKYGWVQSFPEGGSQTPRDPEESGLFIEEWHFKHVSLK